MALKSCTIVYHRITMIFHQLFWHRYSNYLVIKRIPLYTKKKTYIQWWFTCHWNIADAFKTSVMSPLFLVTLEKKARFCNLKSSKLFPLTPKDTFPQYRELYRKIIFIMYEIYEIMLDINLPLMKKLTYYRRKTERKSNKHRRRTT